MHQPGSWKPHRPRPLTRQHQNRIRRPSTRSSQRPRLDRQNHPRKSRLHHRRHPRPERLSRRPRRWRRRQQRPPRSTPPRRQSARRNSPRLPCRQDLCRQQQKARLPLPRCSTHSRPLAQPPRRPRLRPDRPQRGPHPRRSRLRAPHPPTTPTLRSQSSRQCGRQPHLAGLPTTPTRHARSNASSERSFLRSGRHPPSVPSPACPCHRHPAR